MAQEPAPEAAKPEPPAAAGELRCVQPRNALLAYAHAVNLLRRVEPFASYKFGRFASVLMGQIRRRHFVLTTRGSRVVGYFGWARCSEDVARRWVNEGYVPTNQECMGGECFVVATFYAESPEVTFFQAREVRKMHPGVKVYGRRDLGGRLRPVRVTNR